MRRLTQRGFIDYAARRAVGLLCVGAAVASVLGPALGREQCANQPPIRSPLFGPGLHLGDYRLDLVHPNLSDRKAIQDHFKYSVIFGELLREALSKTTAGECGVAFGHTHFPDLHVALTKSAQSTDGSNGRDYCQAAILSLARSMQPSDAEIHASGIRRLEATSYRLAPRHVAFEAYTDGWEALTQVYAPETVQHALLSVQPPELANLDPKNFLSWLERQRASDARELIPLAPCSADRGEAVDNSSAKAQSPNVAPGTIKLRLERSGNSNRRPLRWLVLVGISHEAHRQIIFNRCRTDDVAAGMSGTDTLIGRVGCVNVPILADPWLAFYCAPNDCRSADEEQRALNEVMLSAQRLRSVRLARGADFRGPYLIEIEQKTGRMIKSAP